MRWRRIAFWVTFSTLALIVLALSWLWTADLGVFKPQLERYLAQELGREFQIRGAFHVDLAPRTTIIAEDVRLANADWAGAEDMVTVRRAEVRFKLWSLVNGPLIIELLDIDDSSVLLINPGDRAPNWAFPAAEEDAADDESGPGVLFGAIDIDDLRVRLESAERERPLNLQVDRFDQVYRDDGYLDVEVHASLDGKPVIVDGEFGTWDALMAGKDFGFDFDATLDTFELTLRGRIDDIVDPRRPEFEFTAFGPDIDHLTGMLGLGEEGEGDIRLTGALKAAQAGNLVLSVEGNLGRTEIDAVGEIADLQSFANLQLKVTASGPDLGRVLRLAGIHQVREAPFMLRIDAETRDGGLVVNEANMVFADAHFEGSARIPNFPSIDDAVISLTIEGPDIERFRYITGMPGAATGPFSIAGALDVRDDGIEILELDLKSSLGNLTANGKVGDPESFLGSELSFRLQSDSLARSAGAYGLDGMPDRPVAIRGSASYTQDGIRTLGPLVVTVDGISVSVEGLVPLVPGAIGADLAVSAGGKDLAGLVAIFTDAEGIPALPYSANGGLRIERGGYRFQGVKGTLGSAALSASGILVAADNIAGSRFDIRASGPALEELTAGLGDLGVQDGPFELSASAAFRTDGIRFERVSFTRQAASLELDLDLGLPLSRMHMDFDLVASGGDVRALLRQVEGLEAYEQPFSVKAKGRLRGSHWDFDAVDGSIGAASFQARGDLSLENSKSRTDFTLNLSVPNLADIGSVDGRRFSAQAVSLNAHAVGSNGLVTVDGMVLRIGQSDVTGAVIYRAAAVPELSVDVHSDKLVILPLFEDAEQFEPEPEFDDGRLIPDITVPFDAMRKVNGSITTNITELHRKSLYMEDIAVQAQLRDGALNIPAMRFKARSGEMFAKAVLSPGGGQGEATLQVVARDFAPGLFDANVDLAMTSNLDIDLRSTGTDLRTLAGNANGVIYLDMRGGRLKLGDMVAAIYGNMLEEMLNTMNPARKKDPYTDFECLIVPLTAVDGKFTAAPSIFASTAKIRAVTQGSLDLKTEEIRVGVRTTPRQVVSVSAAELFNPYVQLVGTLAAPRLAVDEAGVLITGGAAVATGGLSLLARGLWDRLSKAGDACTQVSKQALKELQGRVPVMEIPDAQRAER
jgi:hypothetical protein